MKILLVSTELVTEGSPSGGLANSVARLANGLKGFGHQTMLLGPKDKRNREIIHDDRATDTTFPRTPPPWIQWIDIMLFKRLNMTLTAVARAKAVSRRISDLGRTFPPDIILYPNLGGVGLFRPSRIPSIIRISSDTRLNWNNGGYDNQTPFAIFQQITLENSAMKRADSTYAPSTLTAARVARNLNIPVAIHRTPFSLEHLEEDPSILHECLSGRKYLIFVGLLNRLKGVPIIAEILPTLLSRHPQLNFVLVGKEHAGFSGKTMRDHTLGLAGDVSDRVHFLGELPHRKLFPLIRAAEAVVLPSLVDNLPNACLEAMALGKVIVGTQGTSFEELLSDGISGILCQPGNPELLEDAVERALALPEGQKQDIEQNALQAARQFHPSTTIPPLVTYFEGVRLKHSHPITQGRN